MEIKVARRSAARTVSPAACVADPFPARSFLVDTIETLRQQRRHPDHILARIELSYWLGCGKGSRKLLCDMFEM